MVILRSFLIKKFFFEKAPTELIAPKRLVIFSLPYTGLHSIEIRKQIIKLFSPAYPHIQLRCIFRPVKRLSSFFRFKDRIPLDLRSRVVYKFKCQCCDALYISVKLFATFIRAFRNIWEFRLVLANLSQNLPSLTFCLIINLLAILLILMIFLS